MVAVLGFSKEQIKAAVRDMYTVVAQKPDSPLHFPVGEEACRLAGYTDEQIEKIPTEALESFAGVGCPFIADIIQPGQAVLDVGSGSGTDVILASSIVGAYGRVHALDLTPAMRDKLGETIRSNGIENIEILEGDAETIPLPDNSVDIVTSNGVLNLVADKRRAIGEIFRVLKPGGQVQIADIVISSPVTPDCEDDPKLWAECVVGATVDESYMAMFTDAGFEDIEVLRDYDYFVHSPSRDTREVAKQFGAHGLEIRMRRGAKKPSPIIHWARRLDPGRLLRDIQRRGLWGTTTLILAVLACYGTLFAVVIMSIAGVTLAVNQGLWAGSIVFFAVITVIVISLGARKHGSFRPVLLAFSGLTLIVYAMYGSYNVLIELTGFILLAAATWFDFDQRRWARVPGGKGGQGARGEKVPAAGESG